MNEPAASSAPSPSPSPSSSRRSFAMQPMMIAIFGVGVVVGASLASYTMQSNYHGIVDQFQIDYQTHIQQLKNQQMELEQLKDNDLNNTNEGLGAACLPDSTPQKYIDELTTTYQRTTTALQKASHRVQSEINKQESLQLQLSHCEKRHLAIRNTLTNTNMNLEGLSGEVQSLTNQLRQMENELNVALEELDRRDIERVECDMHYRNLVECRGGQDGGGKPQ